MDIIDAWVRKGGMGEGDGRVWSCCPFSVSGFLISILESNGTGSSMGARPFNRNRVTMWLLLPCSLEALPLLSGVLTIMAYGKGGCWQDRPGQPSVK